MKNQTGAVLPTSLFLLLGMTIIAVSGFKSVVTEEKIVTNSTNMFYATQGANSALREGEDWLLNQAEVPVACNGACTIWSSDDLPDTTSQDNDWWESNGITLGEDISMVAEQPRYVIEEVYFIPDDLSTESWASGVGVYYYGVTGRSYGGDNRAERQVRSVYTTRYY